MDTKELLEGIKEQVLLIEEELEMEIWAFMKWWE